MRSRNRFDDVESQVDFKLDISGPRAARSEIDWNSKRAGESIICILNTLYKTSPLMRFI